MLSSSRPVMAAFPEITAGRLLHQVFRGLLSVQSRYGLHARKVTKSDPLHRSPSTTLLPPPSPRLLPAGTTSYRVGISPTENRCLSTAYVIMSLITCKLPHISL